MILRLPHGEVDESKRYTMPDPDACASALRVVRRNHHYGERAPTEVEITCVILLAEGYIDLTTYDLGQECCVEKLRDIWRAMRAKGNHP